MLNGKVTDWNSPIPNIRAEVVKISSGIIFTNGLASFAATDSNEYFSVTTLQGSNTVQLKKDLYHPEKYYSFNENSEFHIFTRTLY